MRAEHHRISVPGQLILIVVAKEATLASIGEKLINLGARAIGPASWSLPSQLELHILIDGVGELDQECIVYIVRPDTAQSHLEVLVAPRERDGIQVESPS